MLTLKNIIDLISYACIVAMLIVLINIFIEQQALIGGLT